LKYFDASADEFRAIFRATDSIDINCRRWATRPIAERTATAGIDAERESALRWRWVEIVNASIGLLHDQGFS